MLDVWIFVAVYYIIIQIYRYIYNYVYGGQADSGFIFYYTIIYYCLNRLCVPNRLNYDDGIINPENCSSWRMEMLTAHASRSSNHRIEWLKNIISRHNIIDFYFTLPTSLVVGLVSIILNILRLVNLIVVSRFLIQSGSKKCVGIIVCLYKGEVFWPFMRSCFLLNTRAP